MNWHFSRQFYLIAKKRYCKLYQFGIRILIGIVFVVFTVLPVGATEAVYFSYGVFERSVSVSSLEAYAKDGTVNPDLAFFLRFLDEDVRDEFRTALTTSHQISPVVVSQSFYEPMGEQALGYVGNLIQTGKRQNGLYALRSALILAAAQPGGFTLLDVLRQFPTQGMRIDLRVALNALHQGEAFFRETNAVIAGIEQLAQESETAASIEATDIPDLRQPGPFQFSKQTIVLEDTSRNRTYPVDLYLPRTDGLTPASIPVVVLSHGLGASRTDFSEIAEHFASYGFAVALPEFNPVNASIFGPQGLSKIQVPILIGASGYDAAAPLIPEQAYSFTWLTAPEKYLLLARGAGHTLQLTDLNQPSPDSLARPATA